LSSSPISATVKKSFGIFPKDQRDAPGGETERGPYQSTCLGGTLADLDVTKKAEIYHILYQINSAFAAIVGHFAALQRAGVVTAKSSREFQGFTQELQAEFNQEFLLDWHEAEMEDWHRFGKVRQAMEKRLRDPDDVFIHAAERKKELAKQNKKGSKQITRQKGSGTV
jgi:hypothetical protein